MYLRHAQQPREAGASTAVGSGSRAAAAERAEAAHWKILAVLSLALYCPQNLPQQRMFVTEWFGFVGASQMLSPTGGGLSDMVRCGR
jgi:hypothetical protein